VGFVSALVGIDEVLLTIVAVLILLRHMQDVSGVVAHTGQGTMLSASDFRPDLLHAVGGLLVLLVVMTLSVFKPWGMTPYGRHRASQAYAPSHAGEVAAVVREPYSWLANHDGGASLGFTPCYLWSCLSSSISQEEACSIIEASYETFEVLRCRLTRRCSQPLAGVLPRFTL
jgi:hypothetical protein